MPKVTITEINEAHNDIKRVEAALQLSIKMSEDKTSFDADTILWHKKNTKELEESLKLCLLKGIYLNSLKD